MQNNTVVVTGGTGSIGSALTKKILALGAERVFVISRNELLQFSLRRSINDSRLSTVVCDIRDRAGLFRIFEAIDNIDVIYHVAAMKHVVECERNPIEALLTNVVGTQNLIDVAMRFDVSKTILISTDKVVEPINVLGATKLMAERIFLNAATQNRSQIFSIVRFGNVACSRGSVIPLLVDDIQKRRPLIVSEPNVTRFTMKISDAVELVVQASEKSQGGEIFVFKMKSFRLGDLIDVMTQDIAPYCNVKSSEVRVKKIGLIPGEKLHEKLLGDYDSKSVYDLGKFYAVVGVGVPACDKYARNHKKVKTMKLSSAEAERLSKQELKRLVLEYLNNST